MLHWTMRVLALFSTGVRHGDHEARGWSSMNGPPVELFHVSSKRLTKKNLHNQDLQQHVFVFSCHNNFLYIFIKWLYQSVWSEFLEALMVVSCSYIDLHGMAVVYRNPMNPTCHGWKLEVAIVALDLLCRGVGRGIGSSWLLFRWMGRFPDQWLLFLVPVKGGIGGI